MNQPQYTDVTYPNHPPYDDMLVYDENLSEIVKAQEGQQPPISKFCSICDYPMNLVIVAKPCQHYYCFKCYSQSEKLCRLCNDIIKNYITLEKNDQFLSCDLENCKKYFSSDEELQGHQLQHKEIEREMKGQQQEFNLILQ